MRNIQFALFVSECIIVNYSLCTTIVQHSWTAVVYHKQTTEVFKEGFV